MDLKRSLFDGNLICLAPIDHEKDPEVESKWTHDAEYLRLVSLEAARPLSPAQVKKKYEKIEKQVEESKNLFHFTIRARPEEHLIGFARIYAVSWSHAAGLIQLGIGGTEDRRKGHGSEALALLQRYAFDELNLYRLTALVPEYNAAALRFFQKAGFVVEVCRREALNRDGRHWDLLHLGLLQAEWRQRKGSMVVSEGGSNEG